MSSSWDHPRELWVNGRLVPWDQCTVHMTSGYAQRGASIFEGIRIYQTGTPREYLALGFEDHLRRLDDTWSSLSLPISYSADLIKEGLSSLLRQRADLQDAYCRVTRFLDLRTADSPKEPDGVFVALYKVAPLLGKPVTCVTGAWRRHEIALPAQMKIGGNYFLLSWARQRAQQAGADDAILLNERDCVAEATGTAVFIITSHGLATPPQSEGALPSITAKIVCKLAAEMGIDTTVRPLHRSELLRSKGVFLAGSLDELRPVTSVDGVHLAQALETAEIASLFKRFEAACRGNSSPAVGTIFRI
jgi:branched-chain amino acid aminotransferase